MKDILLATIPATIPTLAVLVGILLNQTGLNKLDVRISAVEAKLGSRIDALSRQLHDDIVMLIDRDTDKAERLARLEERSKN